MISAASQCICLSSGRRQRIGFLPSRIVVIPRDGLFRFGVWTIGAALLVSQLLFASLAVAQKVPGLGYVYPPAVPVGQATDVQLGGYDFTPDLQWFVHESRVQLQTLGPAGDYHVPPPPYWFGPRASMPAPPIPREVPARLTLDPAMPAGLVRWQVANANGSSGTGVFYASRGLEITESRSRDFPQRITALPVAVSGRLSRLTEVDRYEILADQDGFISVELFARRLGSDFLGVIEVHDGDGRLLCDLVDTPGQDGAVTFAVSAGKLYTISLHDVDFRGDRAYVYRLAIRRGTRVLGMLPAAAQRGTTREFEFVGLGFATGKPVLEPVRRTVAIPNDPQLAAFAYALETPAGNVEVLIPLSELVEQVADPLPAGDSPRTRQLAMLGGVTSRFPRQDDEHRYTWMAEKDQHYSLAALSRAIGGRLDMMLAVLDPEGKPVGDSDDAGASTDASLEIKAATSGMYTCVVRSLTARENALDELYRLQIVQRMPDFMLTMAQQINLPSAGKVEVTIQAQRLGGFDGEIAIALEGLPPGVTSQGDLVIGAGKNEVKITLQSAADAPVVATVLRVRGTAKIGEQSVTRDAIAGAAGNLAPRSADEQRIPQIMLAMTMPAPFEIQVIDRERQHDVHRGTTFLADLEIVRTNGFKGPLQLEMSAQQDRLRQGTRGPIVPVAAEADRAVYPCFLPEWLGTDLTRRIVIHGAAVIPDPKGTPRYVTKAAGSRITMIMEGALLKLSGEIADPGVRAGDTWEIKVTTWRSAKLPLDTRIELSVPDEVAGLLQAEPLVLAAGSNEGILRIVSRADPRLAGPWTLRITATALQEGKWPVVAETGVQVEVAAP